MVKIFNLIFYTKIFRDLFFRFTLFQLYILNIASVLDLTLVDLPGITKVAVDDQPDDIETLVK